MTEAGDSQGLQSCANPDPLTKSSQPADALLGEMRGWVPKANWADLSLQRLLEEVEATKIPHDVILLFGEGWHAADGPSVIVKGRVFVPSH